MMMNKLIIQATDRSQFEKWLREGGSFLILVKDKLKIIYLIIIDSKTI